MKYRTLIYLFFISISGILDSCAENSNVDRAADEMARETENAIANVGTEIREESDELMMEFEETRRKINTRMAMIEADMENASAEAKAEMHEELNELKMYREEVDARMKRAGNNLEKGWEDFKGDVEKGWKNFSRESRETLEEIERELEPAEDLDEY